jgi:glycosyltransferase involved in cell wall biosynthesis
MNQKNQYYVWVAFQRRPVSMQCYFNYDLIFIKPFITTKWLKPVDYILKGIKTMFKLLKDRPKILWIQLPPTPLLFLTQLYKRIIGKCILIVDCHNGVFRGKWKKYLDINKLNKCDIIIVHNWVIGNIAIELGINKNKLIILEDKPVENNNIIMHKTQQHRQVIMPCSFYTDEPLEIVFDAARQIPNVDIIITGNYKRNVSLFDYTKKPDNVKFLGFLPLKEYEAVFVQSDIVLALTTEDDIQLSVANEAVGFEIPMVISDTKLLRELFNKGAIYVETLNANSIANGINEAFEKIDVLKDEIKILKIERNQKWENMANFLKDKLINLYNELLKK